MALFLQALTAESMRALYAGRDDWAAGQPELAGLVWPVDDRRVLRYRIGALDADPASAPYLLHVAVRDGTFVGRIGCHAAPDADGTVEIGYAVAGSERGQGLGRLIVELFLVWLAERGVVTVEASVSPDNEPSLRLLRRRGFVETGERWDEEDGRELVWSATVGWRESEEDRRRRESAPALDRPSPNPPGSFEDFKGRVLFWTWTDMEPLHYLVDLMAGDAAALPDEDRPHALCRALRDLLTDGLIEIYENRFDSMRALGDGEIDAVLRLLAFEPVPLSPYTVSATEAADTIAPNRDV
jgi:RimJ/RimL family protein N-acetyltransferase